MSLRDIAIPVIGGFHTSVERDCLSFFLQGRQKVIVVPARGPYRRIPSKLAKGVDEHQVSLVYPFADGCSRQTRELASARNRLVVELSSALFVVFAAPGGATEDMAKLTLRMGKPLLTFDVPENSRLLEMGAIGLSAEEVRDANSLRLRLESILR